MKNLAKPICNFCKLPIEYGPGFMMVEDLDLPDGGFVCHEECWQISGTDEGYIERLHETLDEGEENV